MKEALYYTQSEEVENAVQCLLCPHKCIIPEGHEGFCRVRRNEKGKLYSFIYEEFTASYIEPIEKRHLYHFHPGKKILSLGTVGCNLRCKFCNQSKISRVSIDDVPTHKISADEAVILAKQFLSFGIAYDYNEPMINFEYLMEAIVKARRHNLKNVLLINGFINEKPLADILLYVDALSIGLKSFNDDFYKRVCGGNLDDVLRSIELAVKSGVHLEVNVLLIPELNDSEEEIEALVDWLYSLNPRIPLHFLRYFPAYEMVKDVTPLSTLIKARDIAKKKMRFVYVEDNKPKDTYCSFCKEILVRRDGLQVKVLDVDKNKCKKCGNEINLVI
ncbi:AmmeMemoRadiSam system radical SAM enzyme [bacterium]|nr:AmmeMemoRadiSam system radical SAM enzyme [bacterium]